MRKRSERVYVLVRELVAGGRSRPGNCRADERSENRGRFNEIKNVLICWNIVFLMMKSDK